MKTPVFPALLLSLFPLIGFQTTAAAVSVEVSSQPLHARNPGLLSEHMAMLDLVKTTDATHTALRNGAWSDVRTWKDQRIPIGDATVLIPEGVTVVVDRTEPARLRAVRMDGVLLFAPDRDTALLVETMVISPLGHLAIGTPEHPIAGNRSAKITFLDRGAIDTAWDSHLLSRGLISHGAVTICGAATTPYATLVKPAMAGATKLDLALRPVNWKPGDRLLLPGVHPQRGEDEEVPIIEVNGAEITVPSLAFDHTPPVPDVPTYVANLSRNVVFESENKSALDRFGHVMFMHAPLVSLGYAAFRYLGRTDKLKPIDDPRFDEQGKLIAGTGANPRGRYAVHFHRTGTAGGDGPVHVRGCVVTNGPGWGFVNHSSNVDFDGNVAFDVVGSAFVTEAGDEIGAFRRNFAVRSTGSGQDEVERQRVQDFGHEGDGFWFQGGGVIVENNIAAGQASSGFIFFTKGLEQEGLGIMRFAVANLWEKSWAGRLDRVDPKDPARINDPDTVPVIFVPVRSFKGNVAFACASGFTSRFLQPRAERSVYEDGLVWNCRRGVHVRYTSNFDLRNLRLIGNPREKGGEAAVKGTLEGEQDIRYENLRVEGWQTGIAVPEAGHHVIAGGFYNNVRSIVIPTPLQRGRRVEIIGDVKFGTLEPAGKDVPQYDVYMDARFSGLLQGSSGYRDPNVLFAADTTTLGTLKYAGQQLYYPEQAVGAVPFPREQDPATIKRTGRFAGSLPDELLGKTTDEMWRQYGVALAGTVAPADATAAPRIHGLIGRPAIYPPELRPVSIHTTRTDGYQFASVNMRDKQPATDPTPVNLRNGWNLVTSTGPGRLRSFLIFAGEMKESGKKSEKYANPEAALAKPKAALKETDR